MTEIPKFTQETLDSGRVCAGCGGKLTGIETVDNSGEKTVWAGCEHCSVYENGVSQQVFDIARKLVVEDKKHLYNHMNEYDYQDTPEAREYFLDTQTRGMSGLVARILYLAGPHTKEGTHD